MTGRHRAPRPITELPNDLSKGLDVSTPEEITRIIASCDGQIFNGFAAYPSVYDKEVIENIDHVTEMVAEVIAYPKDSAVVIAGAGSSGRIAFLVARAFNAVMQQNKRDPCFHYLIAGGDEALLKSQEGAEDNAEAGVADLKRCLAGGTRGRPYRRIVYIGISCGLTASYVAAQLWYMAQQRHGVGVLIGFNDLTQARTSKAQGCTFSFADVIAEMARKIARDRMQRFFFITPVVGPEALTGSTRMKGGTATKVILETIFGRALAKVLRLPCLGDIPGTPKLVVQPQANGHGESAKLEKQWWQKEKHGWQKDANAPLVPCRLVLNAYEATSRAAYRASKQISGLMEMMARSWSSGATVYYVGRPDLGLVGLLDASEQVPTFGADPLALQAFVASDWDAVVKPFTQKPPPVVVKLKKILSWEMEEDDEEEDAEEEEDEEEEEVEEKMEEEEEEEEVEDEEEQEDAKENGTEEIEEEQNDRGRDKEKKEKEEVKVKVLNGVAEKPPPVDPAELARRAEEARKAKFAPVAMEHFLKEVLPNIRPDDTVVLIESRAASGHPEEFPVELVAGLLAGVVKRKLKLALITVQVASHDRLALPAHSGLPNGKEATTQATETLLSDVAHLAVQVELPPSAALPILPADGLDVFGELAVKLVLNAASTGAQVLQGKVFGNRMIDHRISNEKLLHRAIGTVSELARVDAKEAAAAIDKIAEFAMPPESSSLSSRKKIALLSQLEKVVPTAILAASGKFSLKDAMQTALKAQSIRALIS